MDYQPRYTQPFTLEEARQLEVPLIAEEISRLQNSLVHLQRTQEELKEALSTAPGDADLTEAFEENETVIGSQKERISILRMILAEKGLPMSAHYDGVTSRQVQPTNTVQTGTGQNNVRESETENGVQETGEDGVYL